jgi:multimeric flavodoxin WrbA
VKPKILIVSGSPRRNGNCAAMAETLTEAAFAEGADVEMVYLNDLTIKPCQGCDACQEKSSDGCIIDDDMAQLYSKIGAADAIVIASPVYWFNISGQTKVFIDRLYAVGIGQKNIFKGKRMGVILAYADPDPFSSGAVNALRTFQDISRYLGTTLEGMVYGSASAAGDIAENHEVMEKAAALGKQLAIVKRDSRQ